MASNLIEMNLFYLFYLLILLHIKTSSIQLITWYFSSSFVRCPERVAWGLAGGWLEVQRVLPHWTPSKPPGKSLRFPFIQKKKSYQVPKDWDEYKVQCKRRQDTKCLPALTWIVFSSFSELSVNRYVRNAFEYCYI